MFPEAITYLDYFGTVVFAITGCLIAARKQSDILAFILLGLVTAVGGGTLRDLLIGRTPIFWLTNEIYILLCIGTALVMFVGLHHLNRIKHYKAFLLWSDAIGLATFTMIGTHIALESGVGFVPAILLGVTTACFGGVLRDLLSNEVTLIFRKDIYMTACIVGGMVYGGMVHYDIPYAMISGFFVCLGLRGLAIQYRLQLPGHRYFDNEI
jgi:uncharacterized membrane protein YeiH